jgi:hypothetical protein
MRVLVTGAQGCIGAWAVKVPVVYRMSDSALREKLPAVDKTPLQEGLNETLQLFERLHREGRLPPDLA